MKTIDEKTMKLDENTLYREDAHGNIELDLNIRITEYGGNIRVLWSLNPKFPIGQNPNGQNDAIQLRLGDTFIANHYIKEHIGYWDVNKGWGTGFNASFWGWDYTKNQWTKVFQTNDTEG